ncbi:MAG: DUF1799 domain-containing protein [Pseudomonadota bacterium]|nr:DUF1799 domain-containing protein [Pseudomonadota bacterium]
MRWLHGAEDAAGSPDYCRACKQTRNASTDCEGCTRPELLDEVEPYARLYSYCDTQWRYSTHMPTGMDYTAVKATAETLGIDWNSETLDMIRLMEKESLAVIHDKAEKARQANGH